MFAPSGTLSRSFIEYPSAEDTCSSVISESPHPHCALELFSSEIFGGLQQVAAGLVPVEISEGPQQDAVLLSPEDVLPAFATFP